MLGSHVRPALRPSGIACGHGQSRYREVMSQTRTSVSTLLILGASGDLAARLLMPALGRLLTVEPNRRLALLGSGVEELSQEQWRDRVRNSIQSSDSSGDAVDELLKNTAYQQADVTDPDQLGKLLDRCDDPVALYFALPPSITAQACQALERIELPEGLQLALEKPFGTDRASAHQLNRQLAGLVDESQIHRIDHFLGRGSVLNILGLRFANRVFEPVWNNQHIASVDIIYDEPLGLENRARYYDGAGAMVDMIQSHLLQVLSVFAMEAPATTGEADIRDAKSMVLRATRVPDPVGGTRRARYTAGSVDGRQLPAYVDEPGVDPGKHTETLAEVTVHVDNWRWAGVPFTLRSGKALGEHRREIVVTFKPAAHVPQGLTGVTRATRIRIAIEPDEMTMGINVNGPGDPYTLERAELTAAFGDDGLPAYGEVLEGLMDGDPTWSVRGDTAEECWRIVEPVLDAWHAGSVPLDEYPAGSSGPSHWPQTS